MFKVLIAISSGLLLAQSFNENYWLLAILSITILIFLLDKSIIRNRLSISFFFFGSFFLSHLTWIKVIGTDAWIALTVICLLPWLLIAVVPVNRKNMFSIFTFSAAAVSIEVIRSHFPWGGFPWGLIAYSQVDGPLVGFAQIGGQYLVSFIVVFTAGILLRLTSIGFLGTHFLSSSVVLLLIFISAINLTNSKIKTSQQIDSFKIVGIQGNVPRAGLPVDIQRKEVLNNHLKLTRQFIESSEWNSDFDLILWPESSTDIDPLRNREVASQISDLSRVSKTPILVGATIWGSIPKGPRNVGILWDENGAQEYYVKNHLVPFGEYIPFRRMLEPVIKRISLVPNDFIAGNQLGIFERNGVAFGDVICFEIAYGDYIRNLVVNGAKFITVQTNNATYGFTTQPEQQFRITRFRAIEHQKSIIIASTSGISGVINPDGEVVTRTEQFVPAVIKADLPINNVITFSDRFPRWFAVIAIFWCLISIGYYRIKKRMI